MPIVCFDTETPPVHIPVNSLLDLAVSRDISERAVVSEPQVVEDEPGPR